MQLDQARALIELVHRHAARYEKPFSAAVVDAGGYLVTVDRPTGARVLTPTIAIAKADTAAVMRAPGGSLTEWADSDPVFFSHLSAFGMQPILPAPGGMPLMRAGELIGGIGVSGGAPTEDQSICEAALRDAGLQFDSLSSPRA